MHFSAFPELSVTHQSKPQNTKHEVGGQEYNDAFDVSWTSWFIQTECDSFSGNILGDKEKRSEPRLQNPEVLDAREVHFGDSGDVVSVQIPAERNTGLGMWFESGRVREYRHTNNQKSTSAPTVSALGALVRRHTAAMNYWDLPSKENKMGWGFFFLPSSEIKCLLYFLAVIQCVSTEAVLYCICMLATRVYIHQFLLYGCAVYWNAVAVEELEREQKR